MDDAAHEGNVSQLTKSNEEDRLLKRKDYLYGICLLLVVVILWTSSNFLTQDLYEGGYEKPFLVTYLNTSAFAFYLLPWAFRLFYRKKDNTFNRHSRGGYEIIAVTDTLEVPTSALRANFRSPGYPNVLGSLPERTEDQLPLTERETAKLASIFCFFWFIANWSVNASLGFTSVASATILSSMSGFFTLAIGRLFNVETLTIAKISSVIVSFVGVILVSVSDSSSKPVAEMPEVTAVPSVPEPSLPCHFINPVLGDSLALMSAVFYALYVILLKVKIKEESRIDMQLFFGFVGLFNVLLLWPIGLVLHLTGVEILEMPHGRRAWAAVLINMAITLVSDYVYVLSMLKTTPLVVTIGLSLTIPLAIVGDFFLNIPTALQALFGGFLVLISFVVVGVENSKIGPTEGKVGDGRERTLDGELTEEHAT
ncbi:hypothetical protein BD410DRAFT_711487 [Rickenella mellea]|uniref:Uncharacterized protein n=1 Tax=Rickenella mellea TaxID=50990 RepID=A0A4Y7QLU1_9AGAM|nr:hypothetical protein BD410DRAFT_711487 [Rickenella mellea]